MNLSTPEEQRYYLVGYLFGQRGEALPAEYQAATGDLGRAAQFGYLDGKEKRPSRVAVPGGDGTPPAPVPTTTPAPQPAPTPSPAPAPTPKPPAKKPTGSPTADALNQGGDTRVIPDSAEDRQNYRDGFDGKIITKFASAKEKTWYEAGKRDRAANESARVAQPTQKPDQGSGDLTWPLVGLGGAAAVVVVFLLSRKRRRR